MSLRTVAMLSPYDWADGDAAKHYRQFLDVIRAALQNRGLDLVVIPLNEEDVDEDIQAISSYLERSNPDGLIVSRSKPADELIRYLNAQGQKFVVFGSPDRDLGPVSSVDTDNYSAFYEMTRHVISLGHRHIALLNGDNNYSYARLRESAFRAAARDHGVMTREDWFFYGKPTRGVGSLMAAELLSGKLPPTAFICATDEIAEGAIDTCRSAGILVGRDIGITGYGGAVGHASNITTLKFDSNLIAKELARLISDQILLSDSQPEQIRVPCTLVDGATCARAETDEAVVSTLIANSHSGVAGLGSINSYVKSLGHYERSQHLSGTGSWIFDVQKEVFQLSPEACELLGHAFKHRFKMADIVEHMTSPDTSRFLISWRRAKTGRHFKVRTEVLSASGVRSLEWHGDFVVGNNDLLICAEGAIRDVSVQTQYAEQITDLIEDLSASVEHDLDDWAEISHEVRTPLNAMVAQIDRLEGGYNQSQVTALRGSAQLLRSTLDTILDFVKLRRTSVELEQTPFRIGDLFDNLVKLFSAVANNSSTRLIIVQNTSLNISLLGDSHVLGRVLNNLVSNAIKFTRGGTVHLEARLLSSDEYTARIELSVSDDGVGMNSSQLTKLFQPFEQTDASVARRFGGSGLGLMISQELTNVLGSKLVVNSLQYKGSRFSFVMSFPLALVTGVPSQEEKCAPNRERELKGKYILIADDNPLNLQILEDILTEMGADVTSADDGDTALECLRYKRFDLVLLDRDMPRLDGIETCRRIRASSDFRIPVILASAFNTEAIERTALDVGFNAVVEKRFDSDEFEKILQKFL